MGFRQLFVCSWYLADSYFLDQGGVDFVLGSLTCVMANWMFMMLLLHLSRNNQSYICKVSKIRFSTCYSSHSPCLPFWYEPHVLAEGCGWLLSWIKFCELLEFGFSSKWWAGYTAGGCKEIFGQKARLEQVCICCRRFFWIFFFVWIMSEIFIDHVHLILQYKI